MAPIALDLPIHSGADTDVRRRAKPPALAHNPVVTKTHSTDAALRKMVRACLRQIVPNALEVAAGVGTSEHLHKTRIGLRRLRSVLHVFSDWSTACDPSWRPRLSDLFKQLGRSRDHDMLEASVLPQLRSVDAPLAQSLPVEHHDIAMKVLSSPDCTQLLRELIVFSQSRLAGPRTSPAPKKGRLRKLAAIRFKQLHRQLVRDAKAFSGLNEVQRHRVRKRLKRLRYCTELLSSVFPPKAVKRFLAGLGPAQDILGQYNDLMVANQAFRQQLEADPRAWFAIGWVAARRTQVLQELNRALVQLTRAPKFW